MTDDRGNPRHRPPSTSDTGERGTHNPRTPPGHTKSAPLGAGVKVVRPRASPCGRSTLTPPPRRRLPAAAPEIQKNGHKNPRPEGLDRPRSFRDDHPVDKSATLRKRHDVLWRTTAKTRMSSLDAGGS